MVLMIAAGCPAASPGASFPVTFSRLEGCLHVLLEGPGWRSNDKVQSIALRPKNEEKKAKKKAKQLEMEDHKQGSKLL